MRSANAPEMSAGVMMANIIWNTMKRRCGMVGRQGGRLGADAGEPEVRETADDTRDVRAEGEGVAPGGSTAR